MISSSSSNNGDWVPAIHTEPTDIHQHNDKSLVQALDPSLIQVEPVKIHLQGPSHAIVEKKELVDTQLPEFSNREKLHRHRVAVAGQVGIPDTWGQEELLKDWIDSSAFDAWLVPDGIMSARASLVEHGRQRSSSVEDHGRRRSSSAFDASLVADREMSARASLVEESRRRSSFDSSLVLSALASLR